MKLVRTSKEYQAKLEEAREDLWKKLELLKISIWYGFETDFLMKKDRFEAIWDKFSTEIDEEFTKNFSIDLDPEDE